MEHPAAPLLARDLGRLQHTNAKGEQGMVHVPGFVSTAGMAEEQAEEAGMLAMAIAEGCIETLEKRHGYRVIPKSPREPSAGAFVSHRPSPKGAPLCR